MSAALQDEPQPGDLMIGQYTIEHWLTLPPSEDGSRTELILGHLHVTPPPSAEHQLTAYWLSRWIDDAIRASGRTDLHFAPPVGLKISSALRIGLIPDAVVLNQKLENVVVTDGPATITAAPIPMTIDLAELEA